MSHESDAVPFLSPEQILTAMRPEGWRGLYVLGCFDRRITLYAQQCRALTLVRALFDAGDLQPGQRLGIVGGGISGVTAAVAATVKGCEVDLYEEGDSVLNLQATSAHRYLHPHIYDWPREGSKRAAAGLPLLDWSAGPANEVIGTLREQLESYRSDCSDRLRLHTQVHIHAVEPTSGRGFRVRLLGNQGVLDQDFHLVILAPGFGRETSRFAAVPGVSYWAGDGLDHTFEQPARILVSGTGDGGLIDLARATLREFRHDAIVERLAGLEALAGEMADLDEQARKARDLDGETPKLAREYKKLKIPAAVIQAIREEKRSDTNVVLNFQHPDRLFNPDSSLINRLLALLLMEAEVVGRAMGRLESVEREGERFRVTLAEGASLADPLFDRVVLRHGPPRGFFAQRFPKLAKAVEPLGGKLAELQLTGTLDRKTDAFFRDQAATAAEPVPRDRSPSPAVALDRDRGLIEAHCACVLRQQSKLVPYFQRLLGTPLIDDPLAFDPSAT